MGLLQSLARAVRKGSSEALAGGLERAIRRIGEAGDAGGPGAGELTLRGMLRVVGEVRATVEAWLRTVGAFAQE